MEGFMAKRRYNNTFPSVTGIISQLASFGLMEWFKRTPYDQIIAESKRGKEIGQDIHTAIQNYIETGDATVDTSYPDEVVMALNSFVAFRKEHPHIKLMRSEKELTSLKHSYNGTIDCLGEGILLDWKSAKAGDKDKPAIYDEARIQCAAYVYLVNEMEGTKYEKAMIVSIAKDKVAFNTYEMNKEEIDGYFNKVFLPLLGIWNFKQSQKKEKT
jgi:hypothetical protein